MNDKIILHSDLNAFYASVECMLNPDLKGRPVAVCGDTSERHGIVLAKSEEAKRCGIKTGQANWQAKRLCKDLIIIHPSHGVYSKYSKLTREIYARHTGKIEPYGIDEAWLDVSCGARTTAEGYEIAEKIRNEVKSELGLTVSVGVSFCKIFAKLGSDMKKPDAVTCISKEDFKEKIWPLPAAELLYVGRSTALKLARYGIYTIGELANAPVVFLNEIFGVGGVMIWRFANGEDEMRVADYGYAPEVKSVGHGTTARYDLGTDDEVRLLISELSQEVSRRLREEKLSARRIQLCVKDCDLGIYEFQKPLPRTTQSHRIIYETAFMLFREKYLWQKKVRAVTVRAINLVGENAPEQLYFTTNIAKEEKDDRLERCVENIRSRFGEGIINYASIAASPLFTARNPSTMPDFIYK